jgi:hypothetical protein
LIFAENITANKIFFIEYELNEQNLNLVYMDENDFKEFY